MNTRKHLLQPDTATAAWPRLTRAEDSPVRVPPSGGAGRTFPFRGPRQRGTLTGSRFHGSSPSPRARCAAMSLIEIMVAMTLLVVLMLGLFSAFYQSQRALRLSASQTDVLEGGRSLMTLLTRELTELAPSHQRDGVNLEVVTSPGIITMPLPGSTERTNVRQKFFFLSRRADVWTGLGYFFDPDKEGIGPLYRFTATNQLGGLFQLTNLYQAFVEGASLPPEGWTNVGRVAEGIVHLQLRAYDTNGLEYIPVGGAVYGPPLARGVDVWDGGYVFANQMLPAWIDLEIGVVDPNVFRQYKGLAELNPAAGVNFLKNQAGKVYLFRQRIPIRNHHEP